jgi:hypothetical protein
MLQHGIPPTDFEIEHLRIVSGLLKTFCQFISARCTRLATRGYIAAPFDLSKDADDTVAKV